MIFVYLMKNEKPLNEEVVRKHVDHLKHLHEIGKLILCGPFTDYPGGMVILSAQDLKEAAEIAKSDPFIAFGYKSFEIRTLELANEENHYLL
jgi:uncharacterized protein